MREKLFPEKRTSYATVCFVTKSSNSRFRVRSISTSPLRGQFKELKTMTVPLGLPVESDITDKLRSRISEIRRAPSGSGLLNRPLLDTLLAFRIFHTTAGFPGVLIKEQQLFPNRV